MMRSKDIKTLTREQFLGQFPLKVNIEGIKDMMRIETESPQFEGIEIYRCLNLIIVKTGDEYYSHN